MREIPDTKLVNIAGRTVGMRKTPQPPHPPVVVYPILSMECGTGDSPREPGRLNFVVAVGGEEALEKYGKQ
jgi:hypothetical protein